MFHFSLRSKHKKLKDTMKFPEELSTKIDVRRVNMKVIKSWAEQRVNELLGMEDEVVVEMYVRPFLPVVSLPYRLIASNQFIE